MNRQLLEGGSLVGAEPEALAAAQNPVHYVVEHDQPIPDQNYYAPRRPGYMRSEAGSINKLLLTLSAVGCVAISALAVIKSIDPGFGYKTKTTATGNAPLTDVKFSQPAYTIGSNYEMFSTRVEDDTLGPSSNPYAYSVGEALKTLKFETDYPVTAKLVYDPELAEVLPEYSVYVLVSTFDVEGNDMGLNPTNIEVEAIRPEACWVNDDPGKPLSFEGCTDETSPDFRGGYESKASDGGWVNHDTNMTAKNNALKATAIKNGYCTEAGLLGGPYEEYRDNGYKFNANDVPLPDMETLFINEQRLVHTAIRRQAADWFSAPLSRVFFPDDIALMKQNPGAFKNAATAASQSTTADIDKRLIDKMEIDDPVIVELIHEPVADIDFPNFLPGIDTDTPDDVAARDPRNYSICFPVTDAAKAYTNNVFDQMATVGIEPWKIQPGLMSDGTVVAGAEETWQADQLQESKAAA